MIQRIQSVYLLLAAVAVVVAMCISIGSYVEADGITTHVLKPLGISFADGGFQSTWGLLCLLILSAVIAVTTIFLYRNRMLQIRMTVFNAILLIGYYIAAAVFIFAFIFSTAVWMSPRGRPMRSMPLPTRRDTGVS